MAINMSMKARQTAWICGNVLNELHYLSKAVSDTALTLLPFCCEIDLPAPRLDLLVNQAPSPTSPAFAKKRNMKHIQLWFRHGEEIPHKEFPLMLASWTSFGKLVVTISGNSKRQHYHLSIQENQTKPFALTLKTALPSMELTESRVPLDRISRYIAAGLELKASSIYSTAPYWRGLSIHHELSILPPMLSSIQSITKGIGFYQIIFQPAPNGWISNISHIQAAEERAVSLGHTGQWSFEGIRSKKELSERLFFVQVRFGACSPDSSVMSVLQQPFLSLIHGGQELKSHSFDDIAKALGNRERACKSIIGEKSNHTGLLLNEHELSQFIAFPTAEELCLSRLDNTIFPCAPKNIQSGGSIIGWQNYAGKRITLAIPDKDRARHVTTEGKTGSGKSMGLLLNLIQNDMQRGYMHGGLVLDFHGKLIPDLLKREIGLPKEKIKYMEPYHKGCIFKYNPLAVSAPDETKAAQDMVEAFSNLYATNEWGNQLAMDLGYCISLLKAKQGSYLSQLGLVVSATAEGDRFRLEALKNVKNREIARFWTNVSTRRLLSMQKALHKITPLFMTDAGRMFCQPENVLDFRKEMNEGNWVMVNLPIGRFGSRPAAMFATMIVTQLTHAAMSRLAESEEAGTSMTPFAVHIDEAQRLAASRITEESVVALRKANVCLSLAIQSRDQLSTRAMVALRNISTQIYLSSGYDDASRYAKETGGVLEPRHFLNLPAGTGWAMISGNVVPLKMSPPRAADKIAQAEEIINHSVKQYYVTENEYEKLIDDKEDTGRKPSSKRTYDII